MGLFFGSSGSPLDKEIRQIEKEIDELEDAIWYEHDPDDRDEDTYQLHKLQKKLEELKRRR